MNITDKQIDALKELINIGVGSGADVMNTMLNSHIRLQVPFLKVVELKDLESEVKLGGSEHFSAINLPFKGSFLGTAELVFSSESASKFVRILTNDKAETVNIDSIRAGTLSEVGNIILNAVMGTISNLLNLSLVYSVPNYIEGETKNLVVANKISFDTVIMLARTRFEIEALEIDGDLLLFFEVQSFDKLLSAIDGLKVYAGAEKS